MSALSHIQAATAPAVPQRSTSEGQRTATSVFREAMRQALEPENGPAKNPQRVAPSSPSQTHSASSSSRTVQRATLQSSKTNSANAGSDQAEQAPASTPVQAANGVDVLGSDPSTSDSAQSSTDGATADGIKSLGSAVSARATGDETSAVAQSGAPASKDTRATGKNIGKSSNDGSSSEQATISGTASTAVAIILPPALPATKFSLGTSASQNGTTISTAAGEYSHGTARSPGTDSDVLAKQNETASSKSWLPPAPANPAGALQDASASSVDDLTTTISSSDQLLSSDGGVATVQASSDSSDSNGTPSSVWTLNGVPTGSSGVASKAAGTSNGAPGAIAGADIVPVSAASHGTQPGQSISTASPLTSSVAGQFPTMGNIASAHAGNSAAMSIGPSGIRNTQPPMTPSSTFAAMDRADSGSGGVLLHTSPNQVTVGVSDPGLGWIEVRAERVAGQMTAALTANSTTSHAELTAALPAMSSYLNDHNQAVQHIQVETSLVSGQNATGSQEQSGEHRHRESATVESIGAISGASDGLRASATQRASSTAEIVPQKTKLEGHQFSVRA